MGRFGWFFVLCLAVAASAGGGEWVTHGPSGGNIQDLLVSPHAPRTLYAAAPADGLFRSTNAGRTWEPVADELEVGFCGVAADPSDPEVLYGATCWSQSRIARSFDAGDTWEIVPGSATRGKLVIDPLTPSTLYTNAGRTVGKSTDQGATWEYLGEDQFLFSVSLLAIDPVRPAILYVIAGLPTGALGVWKTSDGGETWAPSNVGIDERRGYDALLVDPVVPDVIYLGTGSGLYRSADAGATWTLDPGLPPVQSLTLDRGDPGAVYALTFSGGRARMFRTLDQGASWEAFGDALPATGADAGRFFRKVVSNSHGRWLAASDCGVYRAGEGAEGWRRSNRGLRAGGMTSVVADPEGQQLLYAGNSSCGTFKSSDGGRSWSRLPDPSSSGTFSLAIDPNNPRRLYATTLRGLYHGKRGGRSWRSIAVETSVVARVAPRDLIRVHPREASHLYAGTSRYLAFSKDRGETWTLGDLRREREISGLRELVVHPQDGSTLFLATRGRGVLRSVDGGAVWRRRNRGIPKLGGRIEIWDLAIDPGNGDVLYAALPTRGVYKSVNGGRRWLPANGGIETLSVLSILVDPEDSETIYVGTLENGVHRSRDGGRIWRPLRGLDAMRVYDLALSGSILHAAAESAMYSYDLSD